MNYKLDGCKVSNDSMDVRSIKNRLTKLKVIWDANDSEDESVLAFMDSSDAEILRNEGFSVAEDGSAYILER